MRQRFNPAAYAVSNNPPPPIVTPQIPPPLPARAYGMTEMDKKVKAAVDTVLKHLPVGQRVYCSLYGGSTGIIYEITGEQHPETCEQLGRGCVVMGGQAYFKIVFLGERSHLSSIPESLLRGSSQWDVLEGIATAEEIKTALAENEIRQAAAKQAKLAKESAKAQERAALPAKHPMLQTMAKEGRNKRSGVIAAINMRIQLNCAFPGTKFSIRSDSSGGSSINVRWTGGPTEDSVTAITNKYKQGHYDGQAESYEYSENNVWPDVFGGVQYVFTDRDIPMALRQQVTEIIEKLYNDRDAAARETSSLLARSVIPVNFILKGVGRDGHGYTLDWVAPVRPAHVPPAGDGNGVQTPSGKLSLVQGIHTKKHIPIWTASLNVRVERPEFESLRNQAKALGGYYSMYRGEGAIPGFIFTTEESANQFMQQQWVKERFAPPQEPSSAPAASSDASVTPPEAPETKNEQPAEPTEPSCPEIPVDSAPEPMQAMEAIGGPLTQPMRHSFGFFPPRPVKTLDPEPVNETEQPEPEQLAARDPWVLPDHPFNEPQPVTAVITPDAASVRSVPSWRRRFGH